MKRPAPGIGYAVTDTIEDLFCAVHSAETTTVEVMQRATRQFGWPGCLESAPCRRAIGVLRCSLPNADAHWGATLTKRGMQALARAAGVLVPFAHPVRPDEPVEKQIGREVLRHGAIVLKGRNDGGVVVCHRATTSADDSAAQPVRCSQNGRDASTAPNQSVISRTIGMRKRIEAPSMRSRAPGKSGSRSEERQNMRWKMSVPCGCEPTTY